VSAGRRTPTSYWTGWSKRYTNEGPFIEPVWSIIPTGDRKADSNGRRNTDGVFS